jgi:hypothetical protein
MYDSFYRNNYDNPYNIEKFEIEGKQMYRLLVEEGPFVLKVSDVNVTSKKNIYNKTIDNGYIKYNYGVACVLDMNNEPVYNSPTSFVPSNNIERDGKPWVIKNNSSIKIDQNGEAMFQWSAAKALDKGIKPSPEQVLMGVEERHENSGMIYITIHPICVEETHYNDATATRGLTRGLTRGITNSSAARVGYGSGALTKSKTSNAVAIPNSRFILPIRLRIIGDSFINTKCAKDLSSAIRVEELQSKTGCIPDFD